VGITNSLWGGCDWGHGDIDIDIDRHNNINVGNKIEVNQNNVKWKHNAENRRGVPYRDAKTRETFSKPLAGADQRRDYRGRDADREKAQATLQQRGIDPAQGRDKLRNEPQTRERAQAATQNVDRDKARAATQNVDRDRPRPAAQNRSPDNAFKGTRDAGQTRQDISRGNASRQAMKAPAKAPAGGNRGGGRRGR